MKITEIKHDDSEPSLYSNHINECVSVNESSLFSLFD